MHLIITDSGLGGLAICARLERALQVQAPALRGRLTYVNAWPEEGFGYNSLSGMPERAAMFDRALRRMHDMHPDRIVIACNTLSIVYEHTAFRDAPPLPVHGIVEAGVDLFAEALAAHPMSALLVLGTRTTVESGVHRARLLERGIAAARVSAAACHGLATVIEREPDGAAIASAIDACAARASHDALPGDPLLAGLACTHYGLVEAPIGASLSKHTGRQVLTLDPNVRLVRDLTPQLKADATPGVDGGRITVEVISKVSLSEAQRESVARRLQPLSSATAVALREYLHVPDLF